jgi:lipid-A-disaccharide synthase-like uncharacterized protein
VSDVLYRLTISGIDIVVTGWKIMGYVGVLLFGGRWVVQVTASRRAGRPVLPRTFWYMSLAGSFLLLIYFSVGKNDSVGVLSNVFPACTAAYNLWLELGPKRRPAMVNA